MIVLVVDLRGRQGKVLAQTFVDGFAQEVISLLLSILDSLQIAGPKPSSFAILEITVLLL